MRNIVITVLIVIGCLLVFNQYKSYDIDKFEKEINYLNEQIKIKEDSISGFQKEICIFVDRIEVAEKKIQENNNKVKIIYQIYEVQIQTIDSYDINQLEQFFSNRYKDSTSTK